MFTSSLNSPAFSFVYILMRGRKKWVLVWLGSQHKRVERPVRPVFPDSLFVSCDYALMVYKKVETQAVLSHLTALLVFLFYTRLRALQILYFSKCSSYSFIICFCCPSGGVRIGNFRSLALKTWAPSPVILLKKLNFEKQNKL